MSHKEVQLGKPNGPSSDRTKPPNKAPITPTKKLTLPVQVRKSPRLNKGTSKPSSSQPKIRTPKKQSHGITLGIRRSQRILGKWQCSFSNTPDDPLFLSDKEDSLDDNGGKTNEVNEGFGDDWAFTTLLESTVQETERLFKEKSGKGVRDSSGTTLNIDTNTTLNTDINTAVNTNRDTIVNIDYNGDWGPDTVDNISAEDGYHSDANDSIDESCDYREDLNASESDANDSSEEGKAGEVSGRTEEGETGGVSGRTEEGKAGGVSGRTKEGEAGGVSATDFVHSYDNLYKEEDNLMEESGRPDVEELHDGMEWPTMLDCRVYMRKYAVMKKFEYRQKQNNNTYIKLICKDPQCQWRVYVRKMPHEDTAKLRSMNGQHTCKCNEKGSNSMAHAGWVANEVESLVRNHKAFKPKDVQETIWMKHGVKISYHTAYSARMQCNERIFGSFRKGYKMVPEMARQIILKNPGSIAQWHRDPDDHGFFSFCLAFKACLDGFINGCRPILGLDGSFLKGKYGRVILSIVSLDGNNGLFPIAIYICRNESYDTWSRFLRMLAPHLMLHKLPLTFMSDRQKGLIDAVAEVFPVSQHRFCFRHMYKNFKNAGFKGLHLETLAWGAARSYKKEDHDQHIQQMFKDCMGAKLWLDEEHKTSWARSHFDTTTKCEHITNNFSESFNKMILHLRDLPIVTLVEKYQWMVMYLLYTRRTNGMLMDGLVPRVLDTIERFKKIYNNFTTTGSTDYLHLATNKHGQSWTVDIKSHYCSCCEWQISGIPCVHAIGVIMPRREGWVSYCSPFFDVNAYRATYAAHIHPMEDPRYWPEPQHVIDPPPLNRPPGRPRVNRIRDPDEAVPAKRRLKKCSKCGHLGHNMRKCKGQPNTNEEGRRVRTSTAAEGPIMVPSVMQVEGNPTLIIPSMPVPKTSTAKGGSKNKKRKRSIYEPSASINPPCTPAGGEASLNHTQGPPTQ